MRAHCTSIYLHNIITSTVNVSASILFQLVHYNHELLLFDESVGRYVGNTDLDLLTEFSF